MHFLINKIDQIDLDWLQLESDYFLVTAEEENVNIRNVDLEVTL